MNGSLAIARFTFLECIRNKLFIAMTLVAVIIVAGNFAMDFHESGIQDRIIFDFGSSTASLLGAVLAVYLVTAGIRGEIDAKKTYFALSSETSRPAFIYGKLLGSMAFVALNTAVLFGELFLIIYLNSGKLSAIVAVHLYVTLLKLAVLCSIAAFFAVSFSAVIAPTLSVFVYILGHWSSYLHFAAKKSGSGAAVVTDILTAWVIPNFRFFTTELVATESFSGMYGYLSFLTLYAISACAIATLAAIAVFGRKDL